MLRWEFGIPREGYWRFNERLPRESVLKGNNNSIDLRPFAGFQIMPCSLMSAETEAGCAQYSNKKLQHDSIVHRYRDYSRNAHL